MPISDRTRLVLEINLEQQDAADELIQAIDTAGGGGVAVDNAIVDGVINRAPSQNIVYDRFVTSEAFCTDRANHTGTQASTTVTGTTLRISHFNASGELEAAPGLSIDGTSEGVNQNLTLEPNNNTGYFGVNPTYVGFDPQLASPNETWNVFSTQVQFDVNDSGLGQGTSGEAAVMYSMNFNHQGSGNIGSFSFLKSSYDIGNGTDPITVKGMAYMLGFGSFQNGVTLNGPVQGYGFQPSATSGVVFGAGSYINAFYDFANIQTAVPGWTSFSAGPSLDEIQNNTNYNGTSINPTIDTFTGNAGYFGIGVFGNLGTFGTGGYQGITVNSNVASVVNATGIYVNMGNVTASGNKLAMDLVGDASINGDLSFTGSLTIGQLNAFYASNPVDGGGNPATLHGLVTQMVGLNGVTTANCDVIGVNTSMLIELQANSINTSGPFGLGFTALALPCIVTTHTGSSLDNMAGAAFAINLDGASTGGTITNVSGARAVIIPNGITTVTNARGFYHDAFAGLAGTNNWGFYSNGDCDNFLKGYLKVGGTLGSTDKVSSASIALEIDFTDRVFRLKPLTTTERNALTPSEGMLVPNSTTSKMQAYMGGAWVDLH